MSTATELKKGSYFIHNNEPVRVNRKEIVVSHATLVDEKEEESPEARNDI